MKNDYYKFNELEALNPTFVANIKIVITFADKAENPVPTSPNVPVKA